MSTNQALLKESQVIDKLYDAESMMLIKNTIADGFVVLLGGRDKRKRTSDIALAFLALTQGNVLDACFGVVSPSRREDTPASRASGEAKELLDTCATTDRFRTTAVQTYLDAFEVVVDYRDDCQRMNCFIRCFKGKKLRTKTERKLRETFLSLAKAVAESQ